MTIQKMTSSVKNNIIINELTENKIRALCKEIPNNEWSGILFYNYEGDFIEGININCVDILPLNIGSSTYTEFDMSPEVISYMTDNDLLDCQCGLIHSHNTFKTFFSDTDINTLEKEGIDRNNFVSLIVNNEGTYTSAITRKVISKNTSYKYTFFGRTIKEESNNNNVVIEYYDLNVIKPVYNISTEFKERINNLKKEYNNSKPVVRDNIGESYNKWYNNKINNKKTNNMEEELFEDSKVINSHKEDIEFYNDYNITKESLDTLTKQIVTGSLFVNNNIIDINQWAKNLPNIMDIKYKHLSQNDRIMLYTNYMDMFIDLITNSVKADELLRQGFYEYDIQIVACKDLLSVFSKLDNNEYINIIIDTLTNYLQ